MHRGSPGTWEVSRLLRHIPGGSTGDQGPGHKAARGAPPCGAKPSPHRRYHAPSASKERGTARETSECPIVPLNQGKLPIATLGREGGIENTDPLEGKMAGTSSPTTVSTKLQRIATLAKEAPERILTTLAHHIDGAFL